jgi:predicted RNA-binding Zn-ribbon protein involved in translation (DUF1610 family)
MSQPSAAALRQFPCKNCGANLVFSPDAQAQVCTYCGTVNPIAPPAEGAGVVQELDLRGYLARARADEVVEVLTVHCDTCGAETTLGENVTAQHCPFCGSGIVAQGQSRRIIKPQSLLPFRTTHDQAATLFRGWLSSLWLAPNDLFRQAERQEISGVYIPAWTYDAQTTTHYTGQRGEDYWVTESYTAIENGKPVHRTRQVRKTRWYPASGTVHDPFNDVLVLASRSLPEALARKLEPWDLPALVPYRSEYLSGFRAEGYQVDLAEGFEQAKQIMAGVIEQSIRRDIGGDHQMIHSVDTRYADTTFKHTLLPLWISAYRYRQRVHRFLVNARTGEVQGERPYSWVKITLLVMVVLAAVAGIMLVIQSAQ